MYIKILNTFYFACTQYLEHLFGSGVDPGNKEIKPLAKFKREIDKIHNQQRRKSC